MISVLVVEDNEYKRKRILDSLSNLSDDCDISTCYSFTSAWKKLRTNEFDLVLMDMSLPTFDKNGDENGGVFRAFGGRELASKMRKRSIKARILFITQYQSFSDNVATYSFKELKENLLQECGGDCLDVILYSNQSGEWRELLQKYVGSLL